MSFGDKKTNDSSSASKLLIFIILLALIVCFVAILIWLNAIDTKRERAVEALKSTITTVSPTGVTAKPIVEISEADLSVDSVEITPVERKTVDVPVAAESTQSTNIISGTPSVAYSVNASNSMFQTIDKVKFEKYTVKEGDTLASIAQSKNLRTQTLVSVNSLKTVYPTVGSTLLIPNQDGQFYTVQEGDTFFSIAQRFSLSISWKTLKEINGLADENISVGMLLFIPYDMPVKSYSDVSSFVDYTTFVSPVFDGYVYGKYDQKIADPLTGDTRFLDGILLQTISEAVVRVSEEGFVVDKGVNELNRTWFVKISHSNGYTTYYDYLNSVNVEIGQKLTRGEIIGQIKEGNTKLDIPTLFFRIEQDGISLDPSLFF